MWSPMEYHCSANLHLPDCGAATSVAPPSAPTSVNSQVLAWTLDNPWETHGQPMEDLWETHANPVHCFATYLETEAYLCDFGAFMASHGASCVLSPVYHLGSWLGEVFEARTKGTATRLRRNTSKGASVRLVKAHRHHQVKVVQWFPNPRCYGFVWKSVYHHVPHWMAILGGITVHPMLRQARIDLREPSRNRDVPIHESAAGYRLTGEGWTGQTGPCFWTNPDITIESL